MAAYAESQLSCSPPSVCGFCDGHCGLQEPRENRDASLEELVTTAIQRGIAGVVQIDITDVTDVEHVRQGSNDGRAIADHGAQLQLLVVAAAFEGQKLLARHRMINNCVQDLIHNGRIHSLQLRALPPASA